mmetsp:Transcript_2731/g.6038  ORF Transcript_2731/g.6038 Transcript_2731/m.6038 type:complete len:209 (+) Transcript_2731:863-1489(+)
MTSAAKYCTICDIAFPTGQSLLVHYIQTHKTKEKIGNPCDVELSEWFISSPKLKTPEANGSCGSSREVESIAKELDFSSVSSSPTSKVSKPPISQQQVLVIDTDPAKLPPPHPCHAKDAEQKQLVVPKYTPIKCPLKGCHKEFEHLTKLCKHFEAAHSFNCSFDGCSFVHFNPMLFVNHVKNDHKEISLPAKRPRSLDDEAAEADKGR